MRLLFLFDIFSPIDTVMARNMPCSLFFINCLYRQMVPQMLNLQEMNHKAYLSHMFTIFLVWKIPFYRFCDNIVANIITSIMAIIAIKTTTISVA